MPAVDPDQPATLSRKVLSLLRDQLGFDGVVVTDALDMAGASGGRGIPEAAVAALAAGADLLCLGADKDAALVREVQAAVVAAVRSGRLSEDRLVEAADRIAGLDARPPAGRRPPLDVGRGSWRGPAGRVSVDGRPARPPRCAGGVASPPTPTSPSATCPGAWLPTA